MGDTAARFGGDEFMFLVRDVRGIHDAVRRRHAPARPDSAVRFITRSRAIR